MDSGRETPPSGNLRRHWSGAPVLRPQTPGGDPSGVAIARDLPLDCGGAGPEPVAGGRVGVCGDDDGDCDEDAAVRGGVRGVHERGDVADRDIVLLRERVREDGVGGSSRDAAGEVVREEYAGAVVRADDWRGADCAGNAEHHRKGRRGLLAGHPVLGVVRRE